MFNHPSFGTIRAAGSADNPLFCLKDVCKALGLQAGHVVARLDKGSVSTEPLLTNGGIQQVNFINEDGLYDVIFDSRKKEARSFRKWVTSEVLPSIRKNGYYGQLPADYAITRLAGVIEGLEGRISALENQGKAIVKFPDAPKIASACTLGQLASRLGVDSYYLKCLLKSIKVIKANAHVVSCATRSSQALFANLPYFLPVVGGANRWDGIILTELGCKEILEALPTYRKQNPYL